MTVNELITALDLMPADAEVWIHVEHPDGSTTSVLNATIKLQDNGVVALGAD